MSAPTFDNFKGLLMHGHNVGDLGDIDSTYLKLDTSNNPLTDTLILPQVLGGGVTLAAADIPYVLWFHFNEGSYDGTADEVDDASGSGNHGTTTGTPAVVSGHLNNAVDGDGSDDRIDVDNTDDINLVSIPKRTFTFWLKPSDTSTRQVIFKEGGGTHGINIHLESDQIHVTCHSSGLSSTTFTMSAAYTDTSDWHFIEMKLDFTNGASDLRIDNVSQDTDTSTGQVTSHAGNINLLYSNSAIYYNDHSTDANANTYSGQLDEFTIQNAFLNDDTRVALYNGGTGTESGKATFPYSAIGSTPTLTAIRVRTAKDLLVEGDLEIQGNFYLENGNLTVEDDIITPFFTIDSENSQLILRDSTLARRWRILDDGLAIGFFFDGDNAAFELQANTTNVTLFNLLHGSSFFSTIPSAGFHQYFFNSSSSGRNKEFRIYGYPTGEALRYGQFQVVSGPIFQISSDTDIGIKLPDAAGANKLTITDSGDAEVAAIDSNGNIENTKSRMTEIGGFAIRLTNRQGGAITKGQLVKADTVDDNSVVLTAVDDDECLGVVLDTSIADDAEGWIVVGGIAEVGFDDDENAESGDWVRTGDDAGYASAQAGTDATKHFQQIGHCIETVEAGGEGTNALAKCVLSFN